MTIIQGVFLVMVDKKKQMTEAVKRLKALKVHPNVIKEFSRNDFSDPLLNYSDCGILFWVENEEWKKIISDFEKNYNAIVYHVIFSRTTFGNMLSLLYVSEHEDEWESDMSDLADGYSYAYVANLDDNDLSEIGSICISPRFGGVVRTA